MSIRSQVDLSYNNTSAKNAKCGVRGTIFSENSQCELCFYEIYWLVNDLHCATARHRITVTPSSSVDGLANSRG